MFLRVEYKKDKYNFYLTGECTNNIPVESLKRFRFIHSCDELSHEKDKATFRTINGRYAFAFKKQYIPSVVVCISTGKATLCHDAYGDILDKHLKPVVENWLKKTNLSFEWVEESEENIVMSA